jgi:hypothetical protein
MNITIVAIEKQGGYYLPLYERRKGCCGDHKHQLSTQLPVVLEGQHNGKPKYLVGRGIGKTHHPATTGLSGHSGTQG